MPETSDESISKHDPRYRPAQDEEQKPTDEDAQQLAQRRADMAGWAKQKAAEEQGGTQREYVVQSGDSLWQIAQDQLGDGSRWPEIYELNKAVIGDNPNLIQPGQKFVLPK